MYDLLRAEIVLAVSSLDCYVHDFIRIGMIKAFNSKSKKSKSYLTQRVSLDFMGKIIKLNKDDERDDRVAVFDQEIRRLHGFKTFQTSESISGALSILGITQIFGGK